VKETREWRICDSTDTPIELFITDLPIIYNLDNKISDHIRFIQLAITPKHLFVCALNNFPFDLNMLRDLTILYNAKILLAQPKYVCSRNKIVDEYHFNPSSTKIHFLNKKLSFIF
jgi:hypothetical protein